MSKKNKFYKHTGTVKFHSFKGIVYKTNLQTKFTNTKILYTQPSNILIFHKYTKKVVWGGYILNTYSNNVWNAELFLRGTHRKVCILTHDILLCH